MWEGKFGYVERTENVDVHYGFEGVGRQLSEGSEEVSCRAGTSWDVLVTDASTYTHVLCRSFCVSVCHGEGGQASHIRPSTSRDAEYTWYAG